MTFSATCCDRTYGDADRDAFTEHRVVNHERTPTQQRRLQFGCLPGESAPPTPEQLRKPWAPPRQVKRLYDPTGWKPGATVIYTDDDGLEHAATVWSDGSGPRRYWVQSADDPAGCVEVTALDKAGHGRLVAGDVDWRLRVRRTENARRRGRVFCRQATRDGHSYVTSAGREPVVEHTWHVDPGCPDAAPGEDCTGHRDGMTLDRLVDVTSGRADSAYSRLCRRCVWLDDLPDPESVTAANRWNPGDQVRVGMREAVVIRAERVGGIDGYYVTYGDGYPPAFVGANSVYERLPHAC